MNTKTFNHFRNTFAFIGFFIIACSVGTVEDETPELPTPVQSNNGKYQILHQTGSYFIVLNTASGSVKQFKTNADTLEWVDQNINGTFTH